MPMQKLAGDSELGADLADLILIEGRQRLNDPATFDQLLDSGHPIVVRLDDVRSCGSTRFDGVWIDGSLPQYPVAIQKLSGAQDPLLNSDEMLADYMPFLLGIAHTRQRAEKLGFGGLDMKRRCS